MKKLVIGLFILFFSTFCFSEVFNNGEQIVDAFLDHGEYVKIIEDINNIDYFPKVSICYISIDEDDIEIATSFNEKGGSYNSYNIKKWNIESDEKGNIIITRK